MMLAIPLIHDVELRLGSINDQIGAFGDYFEILVGDNGGDFDDDAFVDIKASHFEVNPDEIGIFV